ncbi:MAG: 6-hydroxycyclohex-1-ene-1-carbonyl-CoA dehydrogenase [Deltaproteobacteria bacterium]|nr:MAG: 6-hydroxycyclohex-1-ene-1-carbonyl-CoA dehydrogenase [Deltaproteobacteria bacterium]
MSIPDKIKTWQMVKPSDPKTGEKGVIELTEYDLPEIGPGEVLIEIAGCGVCHTDLGYFYDGVPTVVPAPLTLGHEISGTVIAGEAEWVGREVIVPAVMPCNQCDICKSGRGNRCLSQKMPGNSIGIYGGYSSHIVLPAEDLCHIKERNLPLSNLSVIADAVTTPYQAAMRADLKEGDLVIITGASGGVGSNMCQVAKALGAKVVIGIDIDDERLKRNLEYGADAVINSRELDAKGVKARIKEIAKEHGVPSNWGWKIFECSGVKPGQELALALLSFVGKLIVVGYTMAKTEYMLSKLMAFDAEIIGTWGCLPKYYPAVLDLVNEGKIQLAPFIETRPMSTVVEVLEEVHDRRTDKRIILEPDFS